MQIEGYFANLKAANDAIKKLKDAGYHKAYLDMNDHYIDDRNVETNLAGTEMSTSLSGLVLESDSHGIIRDKAPLAAASPMVSGMGGFEEVADVNCKVVVEAGTGGEEKAKQVLKDAGGDLSSPNFKKPILHDEIDNTTYNVIDEIRKKI